MAGPYASDSPSGETNSAFRGERIGKYEILARLTLGGMAELFLAFTSGPGGFRKFVAVKRILPDAKSDENFVKMFLDEARITAALNHMNIAHVFDLGDEEEGLYLAMEFIAGQNLNQIQSAQLRRKQNLPVGFCGSVARDLCAALHYAHTFTDPTGKPLMVIHRDVAQKNIMVAFDGVTKLLDFGIAKSKGSLGKTTVGMVKGTTGYMSPEQVQGHALDGRSDVFSLGVVLHELLTGRRLFSAVTEEEEMRKILAADVPKPHLLAPHIPEALSDVAVKALARDRKDRFATAKEMQRALEAALGPAMFDKDQNAAFMSELFQEKMAATRALLESADDLAGSVVVKTAVKALRQEPPSLVEPAPAAPAKDSPREPVKKLPPPPLPPSKLALESTLPPLRDRPAAAVRSSISLTNPGISRRHWKSWAPAVAMGTLVVGGLTFVGLRGSNLGFKSPTLTEAASRPTPTPTAPALPHPVITAPLDAAHDVHSLPDPRAKGPRGHTGTLTLVTKPPCEVRLNHRLVGRTPLFNTPLPVGLQTLRLRGPDNRVRLLRVTVHPGRNEAQRFELADLPEG